MNVLIAELADNLSRLKRDGGAGRVKKLDTLRVIEKEHYPMRGNVIQCKEAA